MLAADGNKSDGRLIIVRTAISSAINFGCCSSGGMLGLNEYGDSCKLPTFFIFNVSRILIDGESSFTQQNISTLGKEDLKVIRISPNTGRKAYAAERGIRTVRLNIFIL